METETTSNGETIPNRITLGSSAGGQGRSVFIEDRIVIEKLMRALRERDLVLTQEYQKNRPIQVGYTMRIDLDFASRSIAGEFRSGGKSGVGFGLLLERVIDYHWFYGAWDPGPLEVYWFNIYPYEWLTHPPNDAEDQWAFEIFSFLFFCPIQGVDLHVKPDGFHFSIRDRDKREPTDGALELVRVGSMREFSRMYPKFNHGYVNQNE